MGEEQLERMRRLYLVEPSDLDPQVYVQLTDNWVELSVRFLTRRIITSTDAVRIWRSTIDG